MENAPFAYQRSSNNCYSFGMFNLIDIIKMECPICRCKIRFTIYAKSELKSMFPNPNWHPGPKRKLIFQHVRSLIIFWFPFLPFRHCAVLSDIPTFMIPSFIPAIPVIHAIRPFRHSAILPFRPFRHSAILPIPPIPTILPIPPIPPIPSFRPFRHFIHNTIIYGN